MANNHNTVLYCGATDDLYRRVFEHKNNAYGNSFSSRYNASRLVYFESFSLIADAFAREKQIKAGSRKKKIQLIESINPQWKDLFELLKEHEVEELIRLRKLLRK